MAVRRDPSRGKEPPVKIRTGTTRGAQGLPEPAWLGPALELAADPQATLSEFVVSAGLTAPSTSSGVVLEQLRGRVVGSGRSGPGLPGAGDRETAGEPPRANRPGISHFSRPNPILPSGADVASAGSISSLKEGHPAENVGRPVRTPRHRAGRGSGLCAPWRA